MYEQWEKREEDRLGGKLDHNWEEAVQVQKETRDRTLQMSGRRPKTGETLSMAKQRQADHQSDKQPPWGPVYPWRARGEGQGEVEDACMSVHE